MAFPEVIIILPSLGLIMRGPLVEEKQTTAENPEQLLAMLFFHQKGCCAKLYAILYAVENSITVGGYFDTHVQFSPFNK